MSKNTYPLKLPTSVKKAAAELAATEGVSLNQFIAAAVAEKVGSLRAADDFLRERAGTAKPKDMLKYLRRAPKVAPDADDMPILSKLSGRRHLTCFEGRGMNSAWRPLIRDAIFADHSLSAGKTNAGY